MTSTSKKIVHTIRSRKDNIAEKWANNIIKVYAGALGIKLTEIKKICDRLIDYLIEFFNASPPALPENIKDVWCNEDGGLCISLSDLQHILTLFPEVFKTEVKNVYKGDTTISSGLYDKMKIYITEVILQTSSIFERSTDERIQEISTFDPLTGLNTPKNFMVTAKKELVRASRYRHPLPLLFIGIDRVEGVSKRPGKTFTQNLVKGISSVLIKNTRDVDVLCRYEETKFLVLLPEINQKNAMLVASRINEKVANMDFSGFLGGDFGPITVSIGGVVAMPILENLRKLKPEDLIETAKEVLESAREEGNCVKFL